MMPLSQLSMGVCIVIFDGKKRILLGKRKNNYQSGSYGLPGGRVELGESLSAAALRELQEETGLIAYEMSYVGVVRETQEETNEFIHFAFTSNDYEGEVENIEPDKCEGWEWLSLDDLDKSKILPAHFEAVRLCLEPHQQFNLRDLYLTKDLC